MTNTLSYGERIALFQREFEDAFITVFNLSKDYSRKDVLPGERFGFIDWYQQTADFSRALGQFEILTGQLLLTFGAENRYECDRIAAIERNNITNNISIVRNMVNGYDVVYHLELRDARVSSKSQLLQEPHFWLCDITSSVIAFLVIPKDITGKELYYASQS